ncbi:uncharacterized protein LOC124273515 isoform X1 [Haliotis rubra]|uniref:uncharacterized protein LOC124273515 isoform X1 n=1 Tax=Haliotis rubra TaxID=36100 RepID=UPI001EE5A3DE|nr:uncharacterized protein LOC124273515 isoform X1 [Haliotis rubra]XP_046564743.1 uncharacterized protein LOC124273515 isoform X1 [Haliotis rubra]XP_046564744.1 uncharacterized protein LOC124273515 isoform X1 [Haliotis rubra]XP_046564746.1 uncharacterized protein LOC124273515 isoform X1 [Haliotis rubra]
MGHLANLKRTLSRRKRFQQGQTECHDQKQLTRKQKGRLDRHNRTKKEVSAHPLEVGEVSSCESSNDSNDVCTSPDHHGALTDSPARQRAYSAAWQYGHDVGPCMTRRGSCCCHAQLQYQASSQSVPDIRQTEPPLAGPTRRWESDPAQIHMTGIAGGTVDTSYAAGISSGPAHQGNVIVNNFTRPTEATSNSDKDSCSDEDNNDCNGDIRNELKRKFIYYREDFELLLQQAAGILLLYIILPVFVLGCMTVLATDAPLIKFGVLVLAVFVSRFTVVLK